MIKVANAPCSWGVIENTPGARSGYALFLDEVRETGYAGTELGDWGFMPQNPAFYSWKTFLSSWVCSKFIKRILVIALYGFMKLFFLLFFFYFSKADDMSVIFTEEEDKKENLEDKR